MNITGLRIRAGAYANRREHKIKWQPARNEGNRVVQKGICTKCEKEVYLNTNPMPNDINIGGEAVALMCD